MQIRPPALPAIFFGHGSPMIALEDNAVSQTWRQIGTRLPRPEAILCVSAHWQTRGTAVTAMTAPRTIHDFGGFPPALHDMQYRAPGSPQLAARVSQILAPLPVTLDQAWGLDHGTWTVLRHVYPDADIPVVQLSMDITQSPQHQFELGRRLACLRDEGVLIIGSGNVVHNLGRLNWNPTGRPHTWAQRFHEYVRTAIVEDQPERLIDYERAGDDARLAVPTPDHYWPLLYIMGARRANDVARLEVDHIELGALSMLTVSLGAP
jgi:4,5-DOPA dioxygenase extradiol